jgi:hypothetical protein
MRIEEPKIMAAIEERCADQSLLFLSVIEGDEADPEDWFAPDQRSDDVRELNTTKRHLCSSKSFPPPGIMDR